VTVINDVERGRLVIELDRWQVSLLRIPDVDGRLAMPILAWGKLRLEITPMARPFGFAVIPNVLGMMLLRRTSGRKGKRATEDCGEQAVLNEHANSYIRAFAPVT
jgi:hypothetical protein